MSGNKHHLIVYCADNQEIADALTADMTAAGFEVKKKAIDHTVSKPLLQAVNRPEGAILMLITDNFLKTESCMHGANDALKEWVGSRQVIPVVAEGKVKDEAGNWSAAPTSFERVSNIIQYMNFWQDRYLDLRKEVRHQEDDQQLDEHVSITKAISGEIGEFLRYLRNQDWHTVDDFKSGNFKVLRQFTGEESETESPAPSSQKPAEKSLAEIIQDSSEELLAENPDMSKRPDAGDEEEKPPVDVSMMTDLELSDPQPAQEEPDTEEEEDGEEDEDELSSILNEVLGEEDDGEEYHFLGEDPDNPGEFDLDSLFEEDYELAGEGRESKTGENEVLLDLVSDDEEGLVLKEGGGHATPEEILEHAVDLFEDGQQEEGLKYLKKTVRLNPNDNTLRYYYAYSLARYGGDFKNATRQLELILDSDPEHPDAWFLLGEIAENREDFEDARHCFEKVAALHPDYPEVYYRLGLLIVQYFSKEDAKAAGYLKKAITYNPENADAHYLLATLLNESLGDPDSAIGYFETTLKLSPDHPFANYDLAVIYHRQGKLELAGNYYQLAVAANPELKTPQNDAAFHFEPSQEDLTIEDLLAEDEPDRPDHVSQQEPSAETASEESTVPAESPEPSEKASLEDLIETMPDETDESENQSDSDDILEVVEAAGVAAFVADEFNDSQLPEPEKIASQPEKTAEVAARPVIPETGDHPVVLITGATAGIGRATAEIFAKNGYRVIATGRREERLQELKQQFKASFRNEIEILPFDVRDPEAVKAALEKLPEAWQQVDILINNAGLSRGLAPIHEGDPEHWETMIDTNIKGLLYLTRAVAPQMVKRRKGHIINIASSAGKEVYPGGNVYCATKFAVDALTKSMRLDLYQHNVRVSQVAPGHVEETEFARVRFDGDAERAEKVYENFQPLKSADVAEVIYFIATRPPHVNIQDVLMFGTQQAGSNFIDRSGR